MLYYEYDVFFIFITEKIIYIYIYILVVPDDASV